jgi:signal transduction histidine kinase
MRAREPRVAPRPGKTRAAPRVGVVDAATDPLQTSLEIALDLGASLDPQEVIRRLLERTVTALYADRCSLVEIDGDHCTVVGSVDHDSTPLVVGTRWRLTSKAFRRMLKDRQPVIENIKLEEVPEAIRPPLEGVRQTLVVPLIVADRPYAALSVSRRNDRQFSAEETALLQQIGRIAVLALRNARLFAEAQGAHEQALNSALRFRTGVDTALELASDLDPKEVVRRMLRRAVEAVGADRGTLTTLSGEDAVVDDSYGVAGGEVTSGTSWRVADEPMLADAVSQRRPVQVAAGRPDYPSNSTVNGMRHVLLVPFVLHGEVVATLGVSRVKDPAFSDDDIATLQQIGNVAVLAIRNARLLHEAQEASRAKSDFLNLAAHELRTPLSVVNGYLSMLEDGTFGEASPDWARPIRIISNKVNELAGLVDSLLTAARLQAGSMPNREQLTCDVTGIVHSAVGRSDGRARMVKGEVKVSGHRAPMEVSGDPDHIARILDNLINNALTYAPRTPAVKIELVRRSKAAVIRVIDNGFGIARADRERIFERFYRVESAATMHSGTGLGLYISRELAEAMGGSLVLESSAAGKGSTFRLTLPLA